MKKNFMQDVTPSNSKRSIRDIPLPEHKEVRATKRIPRTKIKEGEYEETYVAPINTPYEEPEIVQEQKKSYTQEEDEEYSIPKKRSTHKKTGSFSKKILTTIIVIALIFFVILISKTNAKITITPKKTTSEINLSILTDGSNTLPTKTQITKTVNKTLIATGEQQVEKQASGKIKIINTYKESSQELVKNTRFQAPNGLIYRIRDSIIVPGYTINGGTMVPGTLEVEVFADSAGEDYNTSGKLTFTIPGFSGKEQFDKITAQNVGDITGGYIGIQKVVSDEAKEQAEKELQLELKNQFSQNQNQSTEYILVPNIETLSFGELQDKAEGDSVILSLSASVEAYSFVKKDLSNYIGQTIIPNATKDDMFTVDTSNLTFSIKENLISIMGTGLITYNTDIEKLKKDFLGKKRSDSEAIIDTYHSFEHANVSLTPFWKGSFPDEIEKIEVISQ